MKDYYILGIESSCDETACAIVKNGKEIISNVVATQIDVHKQFGGVIPEVASRIHVENISMVIEEAMNKANMKIEDVDAIAFTQGPGLVGSLHVGVQAAKTLAWAFNKPLVPVHHIAGHIYANRFVCDMKFPLLALVVSGGHTELVYMKEDYSFEILGTTQDDAVGEAGDKVGRVLGLPYPGGVYLDKEATNKYTMQEETIRLVISTEARESDDPVKTGVDFPIMPVLVIGGMWILFFYMRGVMKREEVD